MVFGSPCSPELGSAGCSAARDRRDDSLCFKAERHT